MSDTALSLADATAQMTAPGQMFETERVDVNGIEMTVWKHAPVNLRQVLDMSITHAERDFLVYEGQRLTFDQHYRIASTLGRRLVDSGVTKGDRVAIAARNLPHWVSSFWGAVTVGAVVVPLNAWWSSDEMAYGLRDSGSSILVVDEERLERIRPMLDDLTELTTVVVLSGDPARAPVLGEPHHRIAIVGFEEFLGDVDASATPPEVALGADEDATMFYTSGTTGRPKGAVGSHRNAITNLMNLFFVGQRSAVRFPSDEADDASPGTSYLGCLAVMVPNVAAGGKIVMMHHFEAAKALRLIGEEAITNIGGVPTIAMQIIDHPDFKKYDTTSVRGVSYGGAPAPPELVKRIRVAFPAAQPGNGYGLTETSAALALNLGPDYVARPESCGPAVPVSEVAIVPEGFAGDEPTPDLPTGPDVVGELWVKGPNVVRGYWHKPEATRESFSKGWLHTGDIARIDDEGFIYIVDRAKDMIIRGGENVYSVAVEAAIFEHPDVADCAVVGVPHPVLGEEVATIIVLRPGRVIEAEEIQRHVAHRIANYSVPTRIFFRSAPLPRNPQGKILKRELRQSLLELMDKPA
jgi:long-chain acyl-CoA synthetase